MKIRVGFVSNSSSSSFVMIYKNNEDLHLIGKNLEPMNKSVWEEILLRSDNKAYIKKISFGGVDFFLRSAFGFESNHVNLEFRDDILVEAKYYDIEDFRFEVFPE